MADVHEREASEVKRPPFDELAERLEEKRRDAVRMVRAWAVAEEIFATGTSIEFDSMISDYHTKDAAYQAARRDNVTILGEIPSREKDEFNQAKASMERAFSKDGVQVVLKAQSDARAIRNQMASRERMAQRAQNPQG